MILSADNPRILPVELSIPKAFLDARFAAVGQNLPHQYAIALKARDDASSCRAEPTCVALFRSLKGVRDVEFGLRVAPKGWIAELLSSRKATGYFVFGLQIYDEGITAGAPGRLQLSNLGQPPAGSHDKGQWSPARPPLSVIKCIDTASQISLCEIDVQISEYLILTAEIPTVQLGRWPEIAKSLKEFSATFLMEPSRG